VDVLLHRRPTARGIHGNLLASGIGKRIDVASRQIASCFDCSGMCMKSATTDLTVRFDEFATGSTEHSFSGAVRFVAQAFHHASVQQRNPDAAVCVIRRLALGLRSRRRPRFAGQQQSQTQTQSGSAEVSVKDKLRQPAVSDESCAPQHRSQQ
jgi:hypothetical protein